MNPKKDELFDFIIKMLVPIIREIWRAGLGESCNVIGPRRSRKEGLNGHQSSKIKIMVPKKNWRAGLEKSSNMAVLRQKKNGRRDHQSTINSQMQKRGGVSTNPLQLPKKRDGVSTNPLKLSSKKALRHTKGTRKKSISISHGANDGYSNPRVGYGPNSIRPPTRSYHAMGGP